LRLISYDYFVKAEFQQNADFKISSTFWHTKFANFIHKFADYDSNFVEKKFAHESKKDVTYFNFHAQCIDISIYYINIEFGAIVFYIV